MALGGVATGSIKAQLAAMVAGIITVNGSIPRPIAIAESTGINEVVVAVLLVMFMWTLDKFIRPEHAIQVYEHFYFLDGFSSTLIMIIAVAELLLLKGFLLGIMKTWTYGAVFFFHAVSTLSSFAIYLSPFADGPNLLFFAAWPMLAACYALFVLRDEDTMMTAGN